MRTILLSCLAALGACASNPEPEPEPMPSARANDLTIGVVPSTAVACLTRYTYPWLRLQIDCPTEHVGGDPDHWVMSCAIPAGFGSLDLHHLDFPPLRYEATADELGNLLHELIDLPPGLSLGFIPGHDVSYVYDDQHRLAEIVKLDVNDVEVFHLVVGQRDDAGNPLSTTLDVPPLAPHGTPFPATGHLTHAYTYDARGRLVADQGTFADGVKYFDETVSYDDHARRRDHVVIVDVSGEIHETGPGYNTAHEFLDTAGRLLELNRTIAGDAHPYIVDYRYDRQSRLSTTITTSTEGFTATVDYIYTCP